MPPCWTRWKVFKGLAAFYLFRLSPLRRYIMNWKEICMFFIYQKLLSMCLNVMFIFANGNVSKMSIRFFKCDRHCSISATKPHSWLNGKKCISFPSRKGNTDRNRIGNHLEEKNTLMHHRSQMLNFHCVLFPLRSSHLFPSSLYVHRRWVCNSVFSLFSVLIFVLRMSKTVWKKNAKTKRV